MCEISLYFQLHETQKNHKFMYLNVVTVASINVRKLVLLPSFFLIKPVISLTVLFNFTSKGSIKFNFPSKYKIRFCTMHMNCILFKSLWSKDAIHNSIK
jgi:hypothetical protein